MTLEQEQFQRYRPDFSRLIPYGFEATEEGYRISRDLMNGDFRADITVHTDGSVTGKVMDTDTGEEYYAIHSSQRYGAFVSTLRDAYCEVLHRIAEDCFIPEDFVFPQSNRISHALRERFGEVPDHPFETARDYGVFRYPKNRKWYGLIMLLPRQKVEKETADPAEMMEILNVKIPPETRETLLKNDGVFPCYHMNRDNWVSIALDERLPDGTILDLLRRSREYAIRSTAKKHETIPNGDWILAVNPIDYDVDHLFAQGDELWKQPEKVRTGDIVYFYIGRPVSAVMYRCRVLETDIPYSYSDGNLSIEKVMRLHRIREYDRDQATMEKLRKHGITNVRGARSVTGEFLDFIRALP